MFEAINYEGEQQVTFADIGALAIFARDARRQAGSMDQMAANVETAVLEDLDTIRLEGRQINIPTFSVYGTPFDEGPVIAKALAQARGDA